MSQYFNPSTGHIASDCKNCGRLVEIQQAEIGDKTVCSFCGSAYEVIPVYVTYTPIDRPNTAFMTETGLYLELLRS